jgi:isopentenyl-diphosphate delta-isomerase
MKEEVILVDELDHAIGRMEKMEAHEKGALHRAFSVFIFSEKGEMLLQQRAAHKYHSGSLYTNACCSHPRPGEPTPDAAARRLKEEMGLVTPLEFKTKFRYKSKFANNLTEHEVDHVFVGTTNQDPVIDPKEVMSYKWMAVDEIKNEIKVEPEKFTTWFRIAMENIF